MLRRLFLTITLALLFGLGQQGAVVHGIAHLAEQQETQHKGPPHQKTCDKCVVYAELAAALGSGTTALPPVDFRHILTSATQIAASSGASFHYSARAPPLAL